MTPADGHTERFETAWSYLGCNGPKFGLNHIQSHLNPDSCGETETETKTEKVQISTTYCDTKNGIIKNNTLAVF